MSHFFEILSEGMSTKAIVASPSSFTSSSDVNLSLQALLSNSSDWLEHIYWMAITWCISQMQLIVQYTTSSGEVIGL